MMIRNV